MAKPKGQLTEKAVTEWFSVMDLEAQRNMLEKLHKVQDKVRQVRISALKRELVMLEKGSGNGQQAAKPAKGAKKKKSGVAVKYRDPKSGDTWSGRGRMASWLAEKVKAGEKVEKYLV
jgi:DNA-binding protein H-NS